MTRVTLVIDVDTFLSADLLLAIGRVESGRVVVPNLPVEKFDRLRAMADTTSQRYYPMVTTGKRKAQWKQERVRYDRKR